MDIDVDPGCMQNGPSARESCTGSEARKETCNASFAASRRAHNSLFLPSISLYAPAQWRADFNGGTRLPAHSRARKSLTGHRCRYNCNAALFRPKHPPPVRRPSCRHTFRARHRQDAASNGASRASQPSPLRRTAGSSPPRPSPAITTSTPPSQAKSASLSTFIHAFKELPAD